MHVSLFASKANKSKSSAGARILGHFLNNNLWNISCILFLSQKLLYQTKPSRPPPLTCFFSIETPLFRQDTFYLAELFRQIDSPKKKSSLNFTARILLLILLKEISFRFMKKLFDKENFSSFYWVEKITEAKF